MSELILTKRVRMNKIRQQITLIVLAASVCFGICMVLSIYFIKYMSFNSKVIASRDTSINNYYQTIKNVGICEDTDKDGKYNDKELAKCDPNKADVSKMANTLRYNALVTMANNTNLESIARDGQKSCFDENKNHIDYSKLYLNSKNDNEKAYNLKMIKMCSALRVIPDALPAQKNDEALLASINQIFLLSGFEPEQLSPGNSYKNSGIPGVSTIPVSISVKKDEKDTMKVLSNLEKSIRSFNIESAQIKWSSNLSTESSKLELTAQGAAYYTKGAAVREKDATVYASNKARTQESKDKADEAAKKKAEEKAKKKEAEEAKKKEKEDEK